MIYYSKFDAIRALMPNAFLHEIDGEVTWFLDAEGTEGRPEDTPTDAEIDAKLAELQAGAGLAELRLARNAMLAQTDLWVLPDRTPTQAQLDYRQALRDITETYTSLDDVVWPEKPL